MPGKNLVLKPNQVLFKKDERSDGMFLLRSGELVVYLEKEDSEIALAKVEPGGMVGEMALFDAKPRSASVKASRSSEVTHISQDDFNKLMKQIPKWFTSLMITLSKRLRTTNAHVEELSKEVEVLSVQSSDQLFSLRKVLQILKIIDDLWQAQGEKVSTQSGRKVFSVAAGPALTAVVGQVNASKADFSAIFSALKAASVASIQGNRLVAGQKINLQKACDFIRIYMQTNKYKEFPKDISDILEELKLAGEASAYDPFSVSVRSLKESGRKREGVDISAWDPYLSSLHQQNDLLKMIKIDDGLGFRLKKKEIIEVQRSYQMLVELAGIFRP